MSIEILENTLIKLLVRRGTDADRKNITLDSGELGYTTDSERLYIGNGTTKGGLIAGNKYKGKAALATSLAPCVTGDYVFETDTNTLKVLQNGTGAQATDWVTVSNLLSAGDGTITIGTDNKITVGVLSSGNFSPDCLDNSLEISSDKISLASTIKVDTIERKTATSTSFLTLPSKLKINSIDYNFPGISPTNNTFLRSDATGNLNWEVPSVISTGVAPTTASVLPVGTIVPFASASNGVPYGWLECDGAEYASTSYPDLSSVIGTDYNIAGTSADHFRVPNLLSKALYGVPNGVPAGSTVYPITTASHATPSLSAAGTNFIIKAIGGVTSPTFTIKNNLSATLFNPAGTRGVDKTGVEFNPLSGNLIIERPAPGMVVFNTAGTEEFTFPDGINFVKFTVTGSGAKGGASPGGASATVIGNLSAQSGTIFKIEVANGFTSADASQNGRPSKILTEDGTLLVQANGGIYEGNVSGQRSDQAQSSTVADGTVDTSNAFVLNGYVIKGGSGKMDTNNDGREESIGGSSYFGNSPAPGGGQGAHGFTMMGPPPSNGVVILEWS